MAHETVSIESSTAPELVRVADEVIRTGRPRVVRRNDVDLVLAPVRTRRRKPVTADDLAAFRAAAGSWKGFDTATFLKHVHESRRSSRPPVTR